MNPNEARETSWKNKTDPVKVAFYGRVSTEHEAQLSAFGNQMLWYEDQLKWHPNWIRAGTYADPGITGTKAKKRPGFMKMISDAKEGKFQLVATREISRFARNTLDALYYTRVLKEYGVEVYFVSDGIWTMDSDGELRLSIMATLAQDESRKVSERARAGQYISRQNGVLYGTGNILGYDREGDHYVINPEQARTVRMIYEMYLGGMGLQKIRNRLRELGRERACGDTEWDISAVRRVVMNSTYCGLIAYNKSYKPDFLRGRVNNHDPDTYEYHETDKVPPIVTRQEWERAQELREARTRNKDGKTVPAKPRNNVWTARMECSCGSHFRRDTWHTYKNRPKEYGFTCYRHISKGDCHQKRIPEWKMYAMAAAVIERVWTQRKEAAMEAYEEIMAASREVSKENGTEEKIRKIEKRLKNYAKMLADEDISREEYKRYKAEADEELAALKADLEEPDIDPERIRKALDAAIDFSDGTVPDSVIELFVKKVLVVDSQHFVWFIDVDGGDHPGGEKRFEVNVTKDREILLEEGVTLDNEENRRVSVNGSTGGHQNKQGNKCVRRNCLIDAFVFQKQEALKRRIDIRKWEDVEVYVYIV